MFDHINTHLTQITVDWDFKGDNQKADLDVSAVVFDDMGACIDAAYYNQLSVFGGALTHSGDAQGDQGVENVTVDLSHDALSMAKVIAIVVTAHNKDGTFKDVESGKIRYTAVKKDDPSSKYDLNSHDLVVTSHEATAMIAAFIYRDNDNFNVWHEECWNKHIAGEKLHTFNDCLPQITEILKDGENYLPEWACEEETNLECGKVFNMTKDSVAKISNEMNDIRIGLGWDANGIDLDAGAVIMSGPSTVKKVYFAQKEEEGVKLHDDNIDGAGDGDDEVIDVALNKLDDAVDQIFISVCVFNEDKSLKDVKNAFIRLINVNTNEELARYQLDEHSNEEDTGLLFARFFKDGATWKYQAIGEGFAGAHNLGSRKVTKFVKEQYNKPLRASAPSGSGKVSKSLFG